MVNTSDHPLLSHLCWLPVAGVGPSRVVKQEIYNDATHAVGTGMCKPPFLNQGGQVWQRPGCNAKLVWTNPHGHVVFLSCLLEGSPPDLGFSCLKPFSVSHCSFTSSNISLLVWWAALQGRNSALGARAEPVVAHGYMFPPLLYQCNCLEMQFHNQLQEKNYREK